MVLPVLLIILVQSSALGAPVISDPHPNHLPPLLPVEKGQEKGRVLKEFDDIPSVCQDYAKSMLYGQSSAISALTSNDRYDIRKRPNTSPVVSGTYAGREASTDPDPITVEIVVSSVKKVDQLAQSMTLTVFEITKWYDYRLEFDPSGDALCVVGAGTPSDPFIALKDHDFRGVDSVLWTPDIYISNQVEATEGQHLTFVYKTGLVEHQEQKTVTTSCPMDFARYPFDTQTCNFDVSTFAQSLNEVSLTGGGSGSGLLDITTLLSYQVGNYDMEETTTTTSVDINSRTVLKGTVKFKRNSNSFWEGVFLPDFLLHVAITMSFWVSATAAPARVSVCIIAALTFRIMMSSLYDELPPAGYSVWILDFMVTSQILAVLALVQYGFVQYHMANEALATQTGKALTDCDITKRLASGKLKECDIFELADKTKSDFKTVVAAINWGRFRFDGVFPKMNIFKIHKCSRSDNKVAPKLPTRIWRQSAESDGAQNLTISMSLSRNEEVVVPVSPVGRRAQKPSSYSRTHSSEPDASVDTDASTEPIPEEKAVSTLGIRDADIISYVEGIFIKFDADGSGSMSPRELQLALRFFGVYFSKIQTCELVQSFRESQGSSFKEEPTLDITSFLCLLIELKKFEPMDHFVKEWWYERPSLALDKFTRIAYPALYIMRTIVFFAVLRFTELY
mmetsp:Transcript_67393/g.132132  ORF Transcript_67393/g.132132 Transcript_67393/m.132132 type:complete len:678 (-) Transcript_67393:196-2229(-)|eukprot:CAMPEP_0171702250 /NCGR_PEP_ID=MMETSP0991-20121206/11496_1 /TAXON_ID=483369 /ORGANISM="non described non described, Strain CCMP2098" /LENGTH=677 /DNA_ID=CAMNT_0012291581 /DNA_START=162 /DNA_END=2195 /DNA_ORIENTATION=-